MARRNFSRPPRLLLAADIVCACLAFYVMYFELGLRNMTTGQRGISLLNGGLILVFALALLLRARQYSDSARLSAWPAIGILVRDTVIAAGVTTLLSYLTKGFFTGLTTPSRVAVGVVAVVFLALGSASRIGLGALQRRQYAAGRGVRKIIVVGSGMMAAELLQLLAWEPQMGVAAVGRLRLDVPEWPRRETALAHLADAVESDAVDPLDLSAEFLATTTVTDDLDGLKQLDLLLRTSQATEVIIALDPDEQAAMPKLATFLSLAHVPYGVVPSLFEETYRTSELLGQAEIPVIDLRVDRLDRIGRFTKRAVDLCAALLVLMVLLPLGLVLVTLIASTSGLPVIFKQERVGKNGRHFTLYKLRTMVKDAERLRDSIEAEEQGGTPMHRLFKLRDDPRVTRLGRVLRRLSLDEVPQFANVLKGDMSIVGPRPPLPREVAQYDREHLHRLRVLPGLTGLWQVSGRSDLTFEDMVRLDRYYVDNWSLGMDLRIVLRTFAVLVSRKGAY
jgi:exopolysaccharide biosynthesis polyprenyl glycosylphosphotransferase